MRLQHISDAILELAVQAQSSDEFDSHDVIFWISRNQAREYASDLHVALQDDSDPFVSLHTAIARQLASLPHLLHKHGGKVESTNVRGAQSECQRWRRVIV